MPFFQNRRNLAVAVIIVITLPFILGFLISKYGLLIKQQTAPTTPPLPDLTKGIYKCPATKQFCEEGKDIIKDKTYAGFGGEVATGSAVLAAFDGIATGLTITLPPQFKSEKLNVIYLDNGENNIRATYYFKGQPINFNEVETKEGATLGIIEDRMQYYDTALLFTIIKGDPQKDEKIRLNPKDFI